MGRKPTVNLNLPKGMRARKRGEVIYYYYDAGSKPRKEIPLGKDYAMAVKKWSELEIDQKPRYQELITFRYVADRYIREVLKTKAPATQKDNLRELKQLYLIFDNPPAPIDQIRPVHILKYMDYRAQQGAPIRAKREKALFSHVFNKAREWGYTDKPNPCAGIRGASEKGRKDVYITDQMYQSVYHNAEQSLRDAMDLAYLTAQRPSDVLKMSEQDIHDGALNVTQNKTKTKIRIEIQGELTLLISRIAKRKSHYKIRSLNLIVDKNGHRLTASALREQFDRAREKAGIEKSLFQFRDLRSKAATDKTESSDIRSAQKQLGHTTITMTERYVKNRKGEKVTPTK